MDRFQQAWTRGLESARRQLLGTNPAAAALAKRLGDVSFPGALTLLADPRKANQKKGGAFIADVAKAVGAQKGAQKLGLDEDGAHRLLTRLLVEHDGPSAADPDTVAALVRMGLASQGFTVSPKEAREVASLLQSGEFFGDLTSSTSAVFQTLPKLPAAILKDVPKLPTTPISLIGSLVADFHDLLGNLGAVVKDVADGRLDTPPATLRRTLGTLYGVASIATTRDLMRSLLDPKNRSVRLALILYARANGVPITDAEIDLVRDTVLDPNDPDLGPALAAALAFMKKRYAPEELDEVLGALARQPA